MISIDVVLETLKSFENSKLEIEKVMHGSVVKWNQEKCEDRLRIHSYEMSKDDLVLDIGSYDGSWIDKFLAHHPGCTAVCYEPSTVFFEESKVTLAKYGSRVVINNFGLAKSEYSDTIDEGLGLAAKPGTGSSKIYLKEVVNELSKFEKIKLAKFNIEGGEYECIRELVQSGLIDRIENLQVQFHKVGSDEQTINEYRSIVELLDKTHKLDYLYPFIWENWSLR
jgi:FkbM family methyltransferase